MTSAAFNESGDSEVGEQRARLGRRSLEENVLRLEVPMNHCGTARGVQRIRDVGPDANGDVRRKTPLPGATLSEGLAGKVVHDVKELTVELTAGVDGDDVRVADRGDGPRFGQKPGGDDLVGREIGVDDGKAGGFIPGRTKGSSVSRYTPN